MLSDFNCDECGRTMALDRLNVLDTPQEQPFEKIVTLVQQVLQVPMCAVSLVDQDRQWFKASRGLDVSETPRDISFCTHTIQGTVPFVISDATLDERFSDNPLVTAAPHIRSYAGIPLTTPEGYNIGSLCAIDTKPRDFPAHEISILQNFAKVVVDELELRQIASTDVLTGAMSRRAWMDQAGSEVLRAKRYGRSLSLLILDIDHFKSINDQFGHPVGDEVLAGISELISGLLRNMDAFGRYGGEEFVAILPETNPSDAAKLAQRICERVGQAPLPCIDGGHITVSIGVSDLQTNDESLKPILDRADKALYRAKTGGRNRVATAHVDIETTVSQEVA